MTTAPPLPAKKNSGCLWLVLTPVILVGGCTTVLLINGSNDSPRSSTPTTVRTTYSPPKRTEVVYELDGTAEGADITYQTPTGSSQQQGVAIPMHSGKVKGMHFTGFTGFVYFSAQNTGETGTVTCRILVNGVVLSENTARGAYAIATCDGTA